MGIGDFTFDPELRKRARGLLLSQFRDKPRFRAIVEGLAAGAQIAEDHAYSLFQSTRFRLATGVHLEAWGDLVGEARGGLVDDQEYRRFVQAAILVNTSTGNRDRVIDVFQLVTGAPYVRHLDRDRRVVSLYAYRESPLADVTRRRVRRTMERIRPPGVAFRLVEASPAFFGFDGAGPFEYGIPAPPPAPNGFGIGNLGRLI